MPRSLRSFLHESVFTLLFLHCSVSLHFDIAQVQTRFTREPLVTKVSLVNLTVACVPEKHRAAFNLRSFLHENVFILLFIEGHNVIRLLQPLVTNVSLVSLTVACVPGRHRAAFNLRSFLHKSDFILLFISTLTSPRSKHASRGICLSRMLLG